VVIRSQCRSLISLQVMPDTRVYTSTLLVCPEIGDWPLCGIIGAYY